MLRFVVKVTFFTAVLTCGASAAPGVFNFDETRKSVVGIRTADEHGKPVASGSGVVIDASGIVATNLHVLRGAATVTVAVWDGRKTSVESILTADEASDIALLRLSIRDLRPAPLKMLNDIQIGEPVFAIGNPMGLEATVSNGIISGIREIRPDLKLIQTTAAISPGSSGGGLFATTGALIGLTSATLLEGQNLNFAIPSDKVEVLRHSTRPVSLANLRERLTASEIADSVPLGSGGTLAAAAVEEAERYTSLEMYDDAYRALTAALERDKFNPVLHFHLGLLWKRRNEMVRAREEFRITANLDPLSPVPELFLAEIAADSLVKTGTLVDRSEILGHLKSFTAKSERIASPAPYLNPTAMADLRYRAERLRSSLLDVTGLWGVAALVLTFKEDGDAVTIGAVRTQSNSSIAEGQLRRTADRVFEGYLVLITSGCSARMNLRLEESVEGGTLSGTSLITKASRSCRYFLDKEAFRTPWPYRLDRLK